MVNVPSGSGKRHTLVGQQVLRCQLNEGVSTLKSEKNQQDEVAVVCYLIALTSSLRRGQCIGGRGVGHHLGAAVGNDFNLAHRQAPAEADEANLGDEIARFGFG